MKRIQYRFFFMDLENHREHDLGTVSVWEDDPDFDRTACKKAEVIAKARGIKWSSIGGIWDRDGLFHDPNLNMNMLDRETSQQDWS